jgi:DNA repair protein RadA/Sms
VEVQALVAPTEGPVRRQVSGLDPRRFQLVAAVLERSGVRLGRSDLFGASSGGAKVDDPACDLALAAALASAATGVPAPADSAFVGEVGLTGLVRGGGAMTNRLAAARAVGVRTVFGPPGGEPMDDIAIVPVRHVKDALTWAAGRRA